MTREAEAICSMDARYHERVTRQVLTTFFDEASLGEIVDANLGQDSIRGLLAMRAHLHFDNSRIGEGLAYVEQQHARIAELAGDPRGASGQRAALGRLCHSVQDYYSHTNYVDLWLDAHGGLMRSNPEEIDPLSTDIVNHPDLCSGQFVLWRDWVYDVPLFGRLVRRLIIPEGSHAAMNLDSPERGPRFAYTLVAASRRTLREYQRAAIAVRGGGGPEALFRFHHCN